MKITYKHAYVCLYTNAYHCTNTRFPSSHPNYAYGSTKAGEPSTSSRIKIVTACLRVILRDESQVPNRQK